ncbi:hypothetical protein [Mastigocoleus testarum]|uniref:hypothetical protein n=1 Tax=Mastigocoleus testarum TaxID=996925 RepID=UPI00137943B9|nr:hypothetical protein [Mastigocoleus testarum]
MSNESSQTSQTSQTPQTPHTPHTPNISPISIRQCYNPVNNTFGRWTNKREYE